MKMVLLRTCLGMDGQIHGRLLLWLTLMTPSLGSIVVGFEYDISCLSKYFITAPLTKMENYKKNYKNSKIIWMIIPEIKKIKKLVITTVLVFRVKESLTSHFIVLFKTSDLNKMLLEE